MTIRYHISKPEPQIVCDLQFERRLIVFVCNFNTLNSFIFGVKGKSGIQIKSFDNSVFFEPNNLKMVRWYQAIFSTLPDLGL